MAQASSLKHPPKNAGYYLRVWRAKWHLSQARAAQRAGISEPMWSLIENNKRTPSLPVAVKLMRLTGVPVSELIAHVHEVTHETRS